MAPICWVLNTPLDSHKKYFLQLCVDYIDYNSVHEAKEN